MRCSSGFWPAHRHHRHGSRSVSAMMRRWPSPARGALDVITADALVEGVHFDLAFTTPGDLGFKALAISLSDLAAMGATPRMAVLSLALPAAMRAAGVDELLDALFDVATRHKVALVGGNITRSPGPLIVDLTAIGSVKRRHVLSRAGARPGDELHVSGTLGAAAAGLQQLRLTTRLRDDKAEGQTAMGGSRQRFLRPEPRVRLGALLGRNRRGQRLHRFERRPRRRRAAACGGQRCRRSHRGHRGPDRPGGAALVRAGGCGSRCGGAARRRRLRAVVHGAPQPPESVWCGSASDRVFTTHTNRGHHEGTHRPPTR